MRVCRHESMQRKPLSFAQHLRAREVDAGPTRRVQTWDQHMSVPVSLALVTELATELSLSDVPRSLKLAGSPARPAGASFIGCSQVSLACRLTCTLGRPWRVEAPTDFI